MLEISEWVEEELRKYAKKRRNIAIMKIEIPLGEANQRINQLFQLDLPEEVNLAYQK